MFRNTFPMCDNCIIPLTMGKMYDLSFVMYFLYTWSTREWSIRCGRTPKSRDSMNNHIFRNTFPMHDN